MNCTPNLGHFKKSPWSGVFLWIFPDPRYNQEKGLNGGFHMGNERYTETQIQRLESNPHVKNVSDQTISYEPAFKLKAVQENQTGKGPLQIFVEHDLNIDILGSHHPKECLKLWRKIYKQHGEDAFTVERRGKGSKGRPLLKNETTEERLKKAEARINYLQAENEFLKKLEELERQAKKK